MNEELFKKFKLEFILKIDGDKRLKKKCGSIFPPINQKWKREPRRRSQKIF